MAEGREVRISLLDLLLFPVSLPARGLLFVLHELRDLTERELGGEHLRERLLETRLLYELGELDDMTYRTSWEHLSRSLAQAPREDGEGER